MPPVTSQKTASRPWVLLFIAVVLVALNMRMTITGVGPLLEQIAADLEVPLASLGILGSLPLLGWAIFSSTGHWLSERVGVTNAVTVSLTVLALGTIWRSLPGTPANLWLGTGLIGAGLAVANVLMPAIIKREFPKRLALVMGVYTALLSGSASLAAGLVVPLSMIPTDDGQLGWRVALLLTGFFLPAAIITWVWATRSRAKQREAAGTSVPEAGVPTEATVATAAAAPQEAPQPEVAPDPPTAPDRVGRRIWGDRLAWGVSIYQGAQSTIFYVLVTWFVAFRASQNVSPVVAGIELMLYQIIAIGGSMLVPILIRGRLGRWLPAILGTGNLITLAGMLLTPDIMLWWIAFGGLVSGASLTTSLMTIAQRARTQNHAAALSGMAQSIGYGIAAIGPIVFGWLQGLSGNWALAFTVVFVAASLQIAIGVFVGRPVYVLESKKR